MTTILVIEDENDLRSNIVKILRYEGYEVYDSADGFEGLQATRQHNPDLIICDVMMPGMDGFEVLSRMRDDPDMTLTPFIFLTAKAEKADMRQGMTLGADDYLTKPFTRDELLDAITARLERAQVVMALREDLLKEAKSQFSEIISHEMRTPLTSISLANDLIMDGLESMSGEELRGLLEIINHGSIRLKHLVQQTSILTEFEAGILNEKSIREQAALIQLWQVAIEAIETGRAFAFRHKETEVIPVSDGDPSGLVLCSLRLMNHALGEIIANAINFSPEGAPVELTEQVEDDWVRVRVRDYGMGIPPDRLNEALELFKQIDRNQKEQQGIGLGLPLVKRIVEAHGGNLTVYSATGKGTEVIISLPRAEGSYS